MQYGKFFVFFLYKTKTTATVLTLKSSSDWHSYPKDSEGIQGWKQVLRSDRRTLSWEDYQRKKKKCFPLAKKHQYWMFKPNFKMHATPHGGFSVGGEDKMLSKHTTVCVRERVCGRVCVGACAGFRRDWYKIKIQIERKHWNHHFLLSPAIQFFSSHCSPSPPGWWNRKRWNVLTPWLRVSFKSCYKHLAEAAMGVKLIFGH